MEQDPPASFEDLYLKHKDAINQAEQIAVEDWNPSDINPIIKVRFNIVLRMKSFLPLILDCCCQYHHRSGTYPYLSENYPRNVLHNGIEWPTAQHAFQAEKIRPDLPQERKDELIRTILDSTKVSDAQKIGRSLGSDELHPLFKNNDPRYKLEVMFRIVYKKMVQHQDLARRLIYDTKEKPIWHIWNDNFWGTDGRARYGSETERTTSVRMRSRTLSFDNEWWKGDNWNGKILFVVREEIRNLVRMDAGILEAAIEEDHQAHCSCPDQSLTLAAAASIAMHLHNQRLPEGTAIARMYKVVDVTQVRDCENLGSFVGKGAVAVHLLHLRRHQQLRPLGRVLTRSLPLERIADFIVRRSYPFS